MSENSKNYRLTPDAPGELATAESEWLLAEKGVEVTPGQVRAVLMYHTEFQKSDARHAQIAAAKLVKESGKGEREAAKAAKKEQREAEKVQRAEAREAKKVTDAAAKAERDAARAEKKATADAAKTAKTSEPEEGASLATDGPVAAPRTSRLKAKSAKAPVPANAEF